MSALQDVLRVGASSGRLSRARQRRLLSLAQGPGATSDQLIDALGDLLLCRDVDPQVTRAVLAVGTPSLLHDLAFHPAARRRDVIAIIAHPQTTPRTLTALAESGRLTPGQWRALLPRLGTSGLLAACASRDVAKKQRRQAGRELGRRGDLLTFELPPPGMAHVPQLSMAAATQITRHSRNIGVLTVVAEQFQLAPGERRRMEGLLREAVDALPDACAEKDTYPLNTVLAGIQALCRMEPARRTRRLRPLARRVVRRSLTAIAARSRRARAGHDPHVLRADRKAVRRGTAEGLEAVLARYDTGVIGSPARALLLLEALDAGVISGAELSAASRRHACPEALEYSWAFTTRIDDAYALMAAGLSSTSLDRLLACTPDPRQGLRALLARAAAEEPTVVPTLLMASEHLQVDMLLDLPATQMTGAMQLLMPKEARALVRAVEKAAGTADWADIAALQADGQLSVRQLIAAANLV